jgi:intracellular sulfur oxidation DsrE/DsrF family protein
MSEQNKYSDEHISAYIDGELDNDERTLLLYDSQRDPQLLQRINDVRMLKEKVQLAYPEESVTGVPKKSFSCVAFVKAPKSLAAGLIILVAIIALLLPAIMNNGDIALARQLINSTQAIAAADISKTVGKHKQVVINISQYHPQSFDATVDNIEALLQQHRGDKSFSIEIVANKNGLKALDTETSLHAERISQLARRFDNLDVIACAKSMSTLAARGNPILLMKSVMITPSAAEQVARRMSDGWFYLKL